LAIAADLPVQCADLIERSSVVAEDLISPLSYRDAGVDIDAGNTLVDRIKPLAQRTFRPEVMTGLGGFGALFSLPLHRFREPVLVSSTDGVGTKLKLALQLGRHDTVGIDLVAMCVNDIVVSGAEPLFFLDYFATAKLEVDVAGAVIEGIARGCELAGAALIGGETAEMPGMYHSGDYDLAGFCVGIAEKSELIVPERVHPGNVLIGLASSGFHSNGYSLVRKVLERRGANLNMQLGGRRLGDVLIEPTRIYVQPLLELMRHVRVNALAHITGGGLLENLPRVLPSGTRAAIRRDSWTRPEVFGWIQDQGQIAEAEMLRTFNCGVGMIVCVAEADKDRTLGILQAEGEHAWELGEIVTSPDEHPVVDVL